MGKSKGFFVEQSELELQRQYALKVSDIIKDKYADEIPMAYVHSYGCQQNVSDGEKLKGMLFEMGFGFTDSADSADIVIYNTCAVREHAESRVFGNVGALKHFKARNPNMVIALCGCMTQQEHIADKIKKSYPHVDLVFGTHVSHKLPELLYRVYSEKSRVIDITESEGVIAEGVPVRRDGEYKAWLPIMYGCNNFCSYCIVPYVRGRERSRRHQDIIEEAKKLVSLGYKEIMLLGQNVNSYGAGIENEISFSKLLRMLSDVDGDFRIRFMTSHPKDASFELIDAIAECDKVCNHLHLPVQCGSNRILKAMNRKYTVEEYLKLIDYAKAKIPDISFTSDIIVGFPGETFDDYLLTEKLIRYVEYDSLYTFIFSPRKGTPAEKMNDPIDKAQKSEWFTRLLKAQEEISKKRNDTYLNKVVRVLPECEGKTGTSYLMGRSDQNTVVEFEGSKDLIGKFVNVRITDPMTYMCLGELIKVNDKSKQ